MQGQMVRKAKHAGSWYSNKAQELDQELNNYIANAAPTITQPDMQKSMRALIGPHAGFAYSGPNAAWAYINIINPDQYDTVFIMGPSHKVFLDFAATTACSEWATPLGNLKVNQEIVQSLVNQSNQKVRFQQIDKKYEENEHSLEMHLPYVRKMFQSRAGTNKDIKIVPLMVGEIPKNDYQHYAQLLLPHFQNERTLFVVSSDFCHWGEDFDYQFLYPNFTEGQIYKSIEKLDRTGMDLIEAQSLAQFQQYLQETKNTICGANPIQMLLAIIEAGNKANYKTKFLKYDQSNQVKSKDDMSVSYASSLTVVSV